MARPGSNAAHNRWMIAGLWLFLYASFAFLAPPLLDGTESIQAETARETAVHADPAASTLLGAPYADSAPLLTWSTAAVLRVAGAGVAQVRLPVALALLLLALLVEGFARHTFRSSRAGLYAAAILLLSGGVFAATRAAPDAVLPCLFATAAMFCFAWAEFAPPGYKGRAPLLPVLGFGVASGLTVLAGGALQAVTVLLVVLLYLRRAHGRDALLRLKNLHPVASLGALLLAAAPWYVLHRVSPVRDVVPERSHAPWIAVLLLCAVPWGMFVPAALRTNKGANQHSLLSIASFVPLLLSALGATLGRQFAGEMLLACPVCAVLLATWLHREAAEAESMAVPLPLGRSGLRASVALLLSALVLALLGSALLLGSGRSAALLRAGTLLFNLQTMAVAARSAPGAVTFLAVVLPLGTLGNLLLRRTFRPALGNLVLAAAALLALSASHNVWNALSPALTSQPFAGVLAKELRPGNLLVVNGDLGAAATLAFSLQREDVRLLTMSLAAAEARQGRPSLLETEGTLRQKWMAAERVFLLTGPLEQPSLPGKAWIVAESGGRQLLSNKPAAY